MGLGATFAFLSGGFRGKFCLGDVRLALRFARVVTALLKRREIEAETVGWSQLQVVKLLRRHQGVKGEI